MASYERPIRITYTRSVTDGTAATWTVNPPPGTSKFRVADINASVTTTFTSTSMTVPAKFGVGVASNTMIAGQLSFGTAGVGATTALALGWASPVAGVASVQATNVTPYNKTTNTGGSTLAGTTSALTAGSNNPVVPTLELTGTANTFTTTNSL
jgi:hypothetical protein